MPEETGRCRSRRPRRLGEDGAPTRDDAAKATASTSNMRKEFWSFRAVTASSRARKYEMQSRNPKRNRRVHPGQVETKDTCSLAARLDKRTLIRRATYDLTGLPPTPEEIEAFLKDDSPDAFAKVVERLLASPAYGERWGRHWLDVVRYADTAGDNSRLPHPADLPLPQLGRSTPSTATCRTTSSFANNSRATSFPPRMKPIASRS